MQLSLQTFTSIVQGMAATVQASSTQLLDLTIGSTLRAMLEASGSVALWMQWLIVLVLQATRAATSSGSDLDSWMADFSLLRLSASPASGTVTFSRYTASAAALVPTNTLVRTIDGTVTFFVVADSTASGWDQSLGGYLINAGVNSLDVPVVAQIAGTTGNVQPGVITVLASALAGIDGVSNSAGFDNGVDAESDAAFRLRFQTFLSSRSRATISAIEFAISSVQQGLSYTIQENQSADGQSQPGNFVIWVDDGSGYPSNGLIAAIQQAVSSVRPIGSTFSVFPPVVTQVDVSLVVSTGASVTTSAVTPQISKAVTSYLNGLSVGSPLPVTRIVQVVYATPVDIINILDILLNGEPGDVIVPDYGVIKAGVVTVG